MKKVLCLFLAVILCLSVCACGSSDNSGNNGEQGREQNTQGDGSKELFGVFTTAQFKDVGNDPNNLNNFEGADSMVSGDDYYYNVQQKGIFKLNLKTGEQKKLTDSNGRYFQLYNDCLYFLCSGEIKKVNLTSGEETMVIDKSDKAPPDQKINEKKSYKGYSTIRSFFIYKNRIYFVNEHGYSGTSSLMRYDFCAYNIDSGTELFMKNIDHMNDLYSEVYYTITTDYKYIYFLSDGGGMHRVALTDIEADNEELEAESIGYETKGRANEFIFFPDGFMVVGKDDKQHFTLYKYSDIDEDSKLKAVKTIVNTTGKSIYIYSEDSKFISFNQGESIFLSDSTDEVNREPLQKINSVFTVTKADGKCYYRFNSESGGNYKLLVCDFDGNSNVIEFQSFGE